MGLFDLLNNNKKLIDDNKDIISGYRWLATLDTCTCLACGILDGKAFKRMEDAPKPHEGCRCLLLPVIKGMPEYIEGDERASVNGPVPANITYTMWFKKQPAVIKKKILGPERYKIYKKGIPLEAFVENNVILPIERLNELYSHK
jgi:hypothetical protein